MKTKQILPKLMLLILLPVFLGMGGLIFSSYMQARDALVNQATNELDRLASLQASSLDSLFRLFIDITDNLSRLETTTNLMQAVATEGSQEESTMYRVHAQLACEHFVDNFTRISSVGLLDLKGATQAHSVRTNVGQDYSDRAYFQEVMRTGKTASQIVISRTTQAMSIIIAVPIMSQSKKDQVIGVAFAGIDMGMMAEATVNAMKIGHTGTSFAVDTSGLIVLGKPEFMGQTVKDLAWGKEILQGEGGIFSYTRDGVSKLASYHKVPSVNLTLAVAQNWDEVLEPLAALRDRSLMLAGAALLLTCLLIFLAVRTLTKPLSVLSDTAQDIANGNWGLDPTTIARQFHNKGELEGMYRAFCSMLSTLKEKIFYYESILDSFAVPLFITDINKNWVFINKAAETLLGRPRTACIGSSCQTWGSPACGASACGITCLRQGNNMSSVYIEKTDTSFELQSTYITNLAGEKIGHVEVVRDVSDMVRARHKAENAMREGMLAAAAQLEDVVGIVSSASTELAAQIELSEQGATAQASRMSETAQAMDAMNATVHEMTHTATKAADMALKSRQQAEDGAEVVRKSVHSIQTVQEQALQLKQDMAALDENARSISQIMNVISDIADQTNLLALNAAIEAARAGDAGRGFAVVADEVRKLAEKTMTSTADVGKAISSIQQSTAKSVAQMDLASKTIEDSTGYANQSGEALAQIVGMVENAAVEVRSIATAAASQSATTQQISGSIADVNAIAAETARAMLEASKAVSDLSNQAHTLTRLIDDMKR